jgi:hypothetical protein
MLALRVAEAWHRSRELYGAGVRQYSAPAKPCQHRYDDVRRQQRSGRRRSSIQTTKASPKSRASTTHSVPKNIQHSQKSHTAHSKARGRAIQFLLCDLQETSRRVVGDRPHHTTKFRENRRGCGATELDREPAARPSDTVPSDENVQRGRREVARGRGAREMFNADVKQSTAR